jgi:NADH-quinone oxidoreductase subunit L
MLLPLILLGIGAAAAGFIPFGNFVSSDGSALESHFNLNMTIAPVAFGLIGIFTAMWLYKTQNNKPDKIAASISGLYKAAYHKFYFDEMYLFVTKKILFNLVAKPAAWIDKNIVDGLVNASGNTTMFVSKKLKGMQSGKVQQYAVYFLVGAIAMAVLFIYWWK